MSFIPSADQLMPDLDPRAELVLLGRALWRAGYDDHLAGHITINRGDGTLWCNPWLLRWQELTPDQVIVVDLDSNVVEGDWPAPLGLPLHLALHKLRPEVQVAVHSHPLFGTTWANVRRVPPAMDQSSLLGGGGELVLIDEYDGTVNSPDAAAATVAKMAGANKALLAGHGVFVLANSVRGAYQRCISLEQRAQHAWHAEQLVQGDAVSVVPSTMSERFNSGDGEGFIGFWEAAVREELRAAPGLLD